MLAKRDAERAKKLAFARGNTPDTAAAAASSSTDVPVVPNTGALLMHAPVRHGDEKIDEAGTLESRADGGDIDDFDDEGNATALVLRRPNSSGERPFIGYAGDEPQYEEHIVEVPPKTGSDSSSEDGDDDDGDDGGNGAGGSNGGAGKGKKKKTRVELRLAPPWDTWTEGDEKSNLDGAVRRT